MGGACGLATFRGYVDALRDHGDLVDVTCEVDPWLELGAIVRRSYDLRAPAPLFHRLKGARSDCRVLGAPAGLSARPGAGLCRIALSLGLSAHASGTEIVDALASAAETAPVGAVLVESAPCQENVMTGDAVDLTALPFPWIHAADGGRYVNTFGVVVVRSPDSAWTNWSISRQMLVDARHMAGGVPASQHLGMIHAQWKALGEATPFATVLGVDPATAFFASMPLADGVDEAGVVGGYRDAPVEVVRCRTVDLEVPAECELVIEGFIDSMETVPEGPMGEYTGYVNPGASSRHPLWHVTAVTHRDRPIVPVVAAGPPAEENHTVWGTAQAAAVLHELRAAGLPVVSCWMPFEAACQWLVVSVRCDWPSLGWSSRAALASAVGDVVFSSKAGVAVPRVSVVENDIDICDLAQIVWADATRCHPRDDVIPFADRPMLGLPIFLAPDDKSRSRTTKVVRDCLSADRTKPFGALERVTFEAGWPGETRARVLAKWDRYGFPAVPAVPTIKEGA
jgi:4-hydroxy-3-polyprenylbenzoate decarboxylase